MRFLRTKNTRYTGLSVRKTWFVGKTAPFLNYPKNNRPDYGQLDHVSSWKF